MNFSDPLFISSGITGVSLVVLGLLTKQFPPREINDFYGYRTKKSMENQEAWDFAQIYSSDLVVWIGVYNLAFSTLGLLISLSILAGVGLSMVFLFGTIGYLFWRTEKEIKSRFGE